MYEEWLDRLAQAVREHRCPRCKAEPGHACIIRRRDVYGGVHAARTSIVLGKQLHAERKARIAAEEVS